ncbi:SMC-Scp complex subunit ScpB [Eisenibacter elegans]|uniref:SMC-Scp complex subunit ScpB n=1 Tax=Eisenibacter elegans TaxID=997 RepID=UPI000423E155|nr:SMC-Scp complex subunit ScpB [Eisenibacter elegans]
MDFLQSHIEALIFCANEPLQLGEIQTCISELLGTEVPTTDVQQAIDRLVHKYERGDYAFRIYPIAEGYQFLTKSDYQAVVAILLKHKSQKRLSKAALETLAIIAYKQPVTKTEVEQIRGVNCDYSIQRLLEKELITIQGKAETVGRPLLYGTGPKFMEHFGLKSIDDLPMPRDFGQTDSEENPQSQTPESEESTQE